MSHSWVSSSHCQKSKKKKENYKNESISQSEMSSSNLRPQKGTYYFPMNKPENYEQEFSRKVMNLEGFDIMTEDEEVDFEIPERKVSYDPMLLPMRTHDTFMSQARYVEHMRENESTGVTDEVSKVLGVTGMPILLSSLEVPTAPSSHLSILCTLFSRMAGFSRRKFEQLLWMMMLILCFPRFNKVR